MILSTFPRSGNSWLRELIRYGSGWTTKLSTTKDTDIGDNVSLGKASLFRPVTSSYHDL